MPEKLHQNKAVIIGLTPRDAAVHSHLVDEDEIAFVGSSQLALTILGTLGGARGRTVYVTPHASTGLNYEKALATAERCLLKSGNGDREVVYLSSRG